MARAIEGAPRRGQYLPAADKVTSTSYSYRTATDAAAGFSGLVCGLFLFLEDQPADLQVQLLGVGEVIDVAQRLILAR